MNVLVLPKQVSGFEPHFFDCFPRLEYIVCDNDNPTFFAQDGILYRRGDPEKAEAPEIVAIPPKLHGKIRLHNGITRIEVPWPDAVLSGNTLFSRGAYGRPLTLTAADTVTWILPGK